MEPFFRRVFSVAKRVLRQLQHDKRFIGLSLMVPVAIIYVLYIFFDSLNNPLLNANAYVFPFGAFIVHFLTFVLTAIVLVRERVTETLTRMMVNGYRQLEIILGYLLAYTTLATAQSLVVLTEITWLFKLDYDLATLGSIYMVMWLLAVISMALGILVSNFANNEGQVFPFIPLVILPSIFLSGMVISIEVLPEWAQVLSRFTPVYYATQVLHALVAGGALSDESSALLSLPTYGLVVLVLASFTLRDNA
jgi:ABC-2 type transport system permease protein